jgi:type IV pilus assembly protein PilQ
VGAEADPPGSRRSPTDLLVDLGVSNPYGALAMTLARAADYVLNLELSALQDQGQGELLSNPRVLTSDRCQATIKQGTQIPYRVQQGQGAFSIEYKDATLKLDVTPQITPSGSVVMSLKISKDAPGQASVDGVAIDTRELETNVHVMDGETVVLGGIFEETLNDSTNKVPFFGDLPGVGFLFKRNAKVDDKTELLIFVTPKIVKDNMAVN